MSHPQMTAAIATQRSYELHRQSQQALRVKQAKQQHGVRVVHRVAAEKHSPSVGVWTRITTAFSKTAIVAPAPKTKLA